MKHNERVFHVGVFVREEMLARNLDEEDLAKLMSGDYKTNLLTLEILFSVRNRDVFLGKELASEFARIFGTSKELWLNLDQAWRNGIKT